MLKQSRSSRFQVERDLQETDIPPSQSVSALAASGLASPMEEAMIKHLKRWGTTSLPKGTDRAETRLSTAAHPLIAAKDPGGVAKIRETTGKALKIDECHGARIERAAGALASSPSSGPPRRIAAMAAETAARSAAGIAAGIEARTATRINARTTLRQKTPRASGEARSGPHPQLHREPDTDFITAEEEA